LRLILSDEEKHHELVKSIAGGLRRDLEWLKEGADMPKLGALSEVARRELLDLTAQFIEAEKRTIEEFQALMKKSVGYRKGLLSLLIKMIIHDSEKHLMILRFLEGRLKEA
jgi:hypothetical protein